MCVCAYTELCSEFSFTYSRSPKMDGLPFFRSREFELREVYCIISYTQTGVFQIIYSEVVASFVTTRHSNETEKHSESCCLRARGAHKADAEQSSRQIVALSIIISPLRRADVSEWGTGPCGRPPRGGANTFRFAAAAVVIVRACEVRAR